MNEYTMALCLFLFGTACVAIGWAVGRVEAKQEYKTRLEDQHLQILDLYKQRDLVAELCLQSQAEMMRAGAEPLTFEDIFGSKQ
jgi:hypothetical protein